MARRLLLLFVALAMLPELAAKPAKSKGGGDGNVFVEGSSSSSSLLSSMQFRAPTAEDKDMQFNGEHFVLMTVEDPPFVSVRESAFNSTSPLLPADEWHGWVIDLIAATASRANFSYELVIPDGDFTSTMSYKAGYAALSEEETIVNGGRSRRVDAFWGVAYVEPKRLYRTFMTAPYWHSPLALIVPHANATGEIVSSKSLRSQISDDFLKPFSYELWRSIIYLFLFAGIFYAVIEPMNREDFQIGGVPTSLYATGREIVELVASAGGVITLTLGIDPAGFLDSNESVAPERRLEAERELLGYKKEAILLHLSAFFDILFHSTYLGFCLICGANVWSPSTRAGKVFTLGVSIFCVIVISAYTANLAVFLSTRPDTFLVSTLEGFRLMRNKNVKVCVLKNSAYYLNFLKDHSVHGQMSYVEVSGLPAYVKALADGTCQGLIERQSHIDYLQSGSFLDSQSDLNSNSQICSKYRGLKLHHVTAEDFEAGPVSYGVGFRGFNASSSAFVEPSSDNQAELQAMQVGLRNEKRMSYWLTTMVADQAVLRTYESHVRQNGCFLKSEHAAAGVFGTRNMSGAFAIVFISAFVAAGFWLVEWFMRWKPTKQMVDVRYDLQHVTIEGDHAALLCEVPHSYLALFIKPKSGKEEANFALDERVAREAVRTQIRNQTTHSSTAKLVTQKSMRSLKFGGKSTNNKRLNNTLAVGMVENSEVTLGHDGTMNTHVDVRVLFGDFCPADSTSSLVLCLHKGHERRATGDQIEKVGAVQSGDFIQRSGEPLTVTAAEGGDSVRPAHLKHSSWYCERNVPLKHVRHTTQDDSAAANHNRLFLSVGDKVEVKMPQERQEVTNSLISSLSRRRENAAQAAQTDQLKLVWCTAQVTKVLSLVTSMAQLENLFVGWAFDDLDKPPQQREIFQDAAEELVEELRALNHEHEHKLICYNWPRLSEHVLRKWRTEPRTRDMMHSAVLEFLYRDFKLKDTATEWAEDGVFIQAVDHAQKSTDEASAGEYLQFERLCEKLQLVLASFFKHYLHKHELHVQAEEKTQVKARRSNVNKVVFPSSSGTGGGAEASALPRPRATLPIQYWSTKWEEAKAAALARKVQLKRNLRARGRLAMLGFGRFDKSGGIADEAAAAAAAAAAVVGDEDALVPTQILQLTQQVQQMHSALAHLGSANALPAVHGRADVLGTATEAQA